MTTPQTTQPAPAQPAISPAAVVTIGTALIGGVAASLATKLYAKAAFHAIAAGYLSGFGIRNRAHAEKSLALVLDQLDSSPPVTFESLGNAQRNMLRTNTIRRAAYVIAATKRVAQELDEASKSGISQEVALSTAKAAEDRYFRQHVTASAERTFAASGLDALANQYGNVLGWYSYNDDRTTQECLDANGKNFRVDKPPEIGYPGTAHAKCRCYPGQAHENAEMLAGSEFDEPIAAANRGSETIREFSVIKHVSSARGVAFFKKPLGSPITEEEYLSTKAQHEADLKAKQASEQEMRQHLLAVREQAKLIFPAGHPERLKAERAVRASRQQHRSSEAATSTSVDSNFNQTMKESEALLKQDIDESSAPGSADKKASVTDATGGKTHQQLLQERADAKTKYPVGHPERIKAERAVRQSRSEGNTSGAPAEKANLATREGDKRLAQGQTVSNFTLPDGTPMSRSEIGDTYEEIFRRHGAQMIQAKFGGPYTVISHAEGGARNTPLDFHLDHTHGGEIKSISSKSQNKKTAIKREEIERKHAALAEGKLAALLIAQEVNQQTGKIDVYWWHAFESKMIHSMNYLGSYEYTPEQFFAARKAAGYDTSHDPIQR